MEALHVLGALAIGYAVWYMRMERKAKKEAQRRAMLRSTEQLIQAALLEKRYTEVNGMFTKKGGK